jgi:hypothetical protein
MTWPDVVDTLREVLSMNLSRLLFSFVAIMVGYAVYRVVALAAPSLQEPQYPNPWLVVPILAAFGQTALSTLWLGSPFVL